MTKIFIKVLGECDPPSEYFKNDGIKDGVNDGVNCKNDGVKMLSTKFGKEHLKL